MFIYCMSANTTYVCAVYDGLLFFLVSFSLHGLGLFCDFIIFLIFHFLLLLVNHTSFCFFSVVVVVSYSLARFLSFVF